MIVVPVLMMSCQVSLNPKIGPVTRPAHDDADAVANVCRLAGRMGDGLENLVKNHRNRHRAPRKPHMRG